MKYVKIVHMRSDKGKAFVMRREGRSYREISQRLGVAKSTLSNWFKGVDFSAAIREELTQQARKKNRAHLQELNRVRGIALEVQYELAEKEAKKEFATYRNLPLFSAGLGIYWGEGDLASKHHIRVSNTDPALLRVWLAFLSHLLGIPDEKVSLALYLYDDLDEARCKRYWTKQLGIKKFHKTQMLSGRHKPERTPFGICSTVTTNSYAKRKLGVWIDQLPEMVLNTVPQKRR